MSSYFSMMRRVNVTTKLLMLAAGFIALGIATQLNHPVVRDPQDFRAFYCAGSAVAAHRDPYLAEPLRACEGRAIRQFGLVPIRYLTMPAPLPGYTLAAFALFARAPFAAANSVFDMLLILALATTVVLLREITSVSMPGILATIIVSGGWASLMDGQVAPIVLLLLCASAFALTRQQLIAGSLYAAGAMLEPHIALPVCISLFMALPKTRLGLAGAAFGLGVISVVSVGWQTNIEYLVRVLPEHALAESAAIGQFSLTSLLTHFGMQASTALIAGDVSYVLTVLFGCMTARRLFEDTGASEFLVAIPAAFVLFGGPFIHLSQMVIAVPALLMLWQHFPKQRSMLAVGLVLIAVPWQDLTENTTLFAGAVSGAVSFTIALSLFRRKLPVSAITLFSITLMIIEAAIRYAYPPVHPDAVAAMAAVSGNGAPADATWSVYERVTQSSITPWYLASHIPTWCGLSIMIVTAVVLASSRPATRVNIDKIARA